MNRFARILALGAWVGSVTLVLALAGPAQAHVSLVGSSPSDGAQLSAFPAEVVLRFSQEITPPAYVIVTGPDGRSLGSGEVEVDRGTVTMRTATSVVPGRYTIAYRLVSADGHPISGQLAAAVGGEPAASAPAAPVDPATTVSRSTVTDPGAGDNRTLVVVLVAGALLLLAGFLALLSGRS